MPCLTRQANALAVGFEGCSRHASVDHEMILVRPSMQGEQGTRLVLGFQQAAT